MTPDFERRWGVEDVTGHRYMAQLTDGPNGVRWLLPFPRRDFEEMWAALCRKHPHYVEQFGSINNFLRQWVGAVFSYLLDEGEIQPDPFVAGLAILNRANQAKAKAEMVKSLDRAMRDKTLPLQVRSEAGNLLAQHEDEMLRGVLDVSKEELTEFMVQEFG
jgi:hypothetical protein